MKAVILLLLLSLVPQGLQRINPNGVWEAETGSRFNLRLTGPDLKVQIVEGSNPRFLKYEVDLKNGSKPEEVNSYTGKGYFLAKLQNGKECKFETEWQIIVVSSDRIMGIVTGITPDPETCAVREKNDLQLDLKKR